MTRFIRRSLFLLLLLLPGIPHAYAQFAQSLLPDTTVSDFLALGDARYADFDNPGAMALYQRAAKRVPHNFDVLMRLARTMNDTAKDLLAAHNKKAAERVMDRAVAVVDTMQARFPDRAQTYFYLAATYGNLALFKGGKSKVRIGRAVEQFARRAIALDSTYALPYIALGIFYREVAGLSWIQRTFAKLLFGGVPEGSREDAVRMFEQSLALDPDINLTHFELALTYRAMKKNDAAIAELRNVIHLPPFTTQDRRNQAKAPLLIKKWGR